MSFQEFSLISRLPSRSTPGNECWDNGIKLINIYRAPLSGNLAPAVTAKPPEEQEWPERCYRRFNSHESAPKQMFSLPRLIVTQVSQPTHGILRKLGTAPRHRTGQRLSTARLWLKLTTHVNTPDHIPCCIFARNSSRKTDEDPVDRLR